jgi:4-hydroxy-4-methyl-2-oxoglutarate aldolase
MRLSVEADIQRVSPRYIEAYDKVATATLGHFAGIRFMDWQIKPLFSRVHLVGTAVTCYVPGTDLGVLDRVEDVAKPGDVIVVDRGGDNQHACFGEFRALRNIRAGIAGWVVDGSVTDVVEIGDMRYPVFARAISGLLGQPFNVDGYVNDTISCGGIAVKPGELVIADDNGICVLSEEEAAFFLADALAAEERENTLRPQFDVEYRKYRR